MIVNTSLQDKLGMGASLLCAVHCAITPLLMPLLITFEASNGWHHLNLWCFLLAVPLGLHSAAHSDSRLPRFLLIAGLLILAVALTSTQEGQPLHLPMMISGGLLLAGGHLLKMLPHLPKSAR
jgi:hypothetical protein